MQAVLSSNDQLALPAELRHQDNIQAGEKFEIERIHAGEYVLKRRTKTANNVGLVDLLLSCPEKGWFEPIESEFTDTL
jgi:bifunctional DNA-binding transcriptional regulator/antitoxin component of YhaV-PrlF toxin-antitoxin module